jgi:hypothetical protein
MQKKGGRSYLTIGLLDLGNVISLTGFKSHVLHNLGENSHYPIMQTKESQNICLFTKSYLERNIIKNTITPGNFQLVYFFFWWYYGLSSSLMLARQVPFYLNHTSSSFCFSYFSDRVLSFSLGHPWPSILLPMYPAQLTLQLCICLVLLLRLGLANCLKWPQIIPSSWDYSCESLYSSLTKLIFHT